MDWRPSEAQMNFDDAVAEALTSGPVWIHGPRQSVVVMSEKDYQFLIGQRRTLKNCLLAGPDLSELDLNREAAPMRNVEF